MTCQNKNALKPKELLETKDFVNNKAKNEALFLKAFILVKFMQVINEIQRTLFTTSACMIGNNYRLLIYDKLKCCSELPTAFFFHSFSHTGNSLIETRSSGSK